MSQEMYSANTELKLDSGLVKFSLLSRISAVFFSVTEIRDPLCQGYYVLTCSICHVVLDKSYIVILLTL